MISWTRPPKIIQSLYRKSIWQTADKTGIAFSFDDGPGELTARLLDWAAQKGIRLVFFVLVESLKKDPGLLKSAVAGGHIIGSHFLNHRSYLFTDKSRFQAELIESTQIIEEIIGKPVKFCRAPYGRIFPWQQQWILELGLTHVFWTLDLKDYQRWKSTEMVKKSVRIQMKQGDIILMHDGPKSQPALIDVLDYIVDETGYVVTGELQ